MTYDLMYVNGACTRQYMFLRKSKASQMLVVANFDDATADVDVNIPAHAFEFLGMKEKDYAASELLTGEQTVLTLSAEKPTRVTVPARGAVVYKLK